ncbi:hypothetical protein GQ600_17556 [Phytophthora cactorum]|nr:hypothetical protein GQ600_17556 [Phytophthora cactorum]
MGMYMRFNMSHIDEQPPMLPHSDPISKSRRRIRSSLPLFLPVRCQASTTVIEKRILRGNNNKISTSELKTEDEERGILDSLVNKLVTRLFKWLYNRGETPLSLRTKMMGHDYFLVGDYKVWWSRFEQQGECPNGRAMDAVEIVCSKQAPLVFTALALALSSTK